jgi:hypothetical protein
VNIQGQERQGPQSFTVDDQGAFYLCDTVNATIQVISPQGKPLRRIPVEGRPGDVAVDGAGDIFVLRADAPVLYRYDRSGNLRSAVAVPRDVFASREKLAHGGGEVLVVSRDQREHAVAQAAAGGTGGDGPLPVRNGVGRDQTRYSTRRASADRGELTIAERDGTVSRTIGIDIPDLASIAFLGEDAQGNLYLQVEQRRPGGNGVSLGVLKVAPSGYVVDAIRYIPNHYSCWTARLLQVNGRGDIYQMLPTESGVELNKWTWGDVEADK